MNALLALLAVFLIYVDVTNQCIPGYGGFCYSCQPPPPPNYPNPYPPYGHPTRYPTNTPCPPITTLTTELIANITRTTEATTTESTTKTTTEPTTTTTLDPILDEDNDGILNADDNCAQIPNTNQADVDGDDIGDECDEDIDGDGISNDDDDCPLLSNEEQSSSGAGATCAGDADGDGVKDEDDPCPENAQVTATNFNGFTLVQYPNNFRNTSPNWIVENEGTTIRQAIDSAPSYMLGPDVLGSFVMTGNVKLIGSPDNDFIGFVFAQQRKNLYYLIKWRSEEQDFWVSPGDLGESRKGFTLHLFDASDNIHVPFASHWESDSYDGFTTLLWENNDVGWVSDENNYDFKLSHDVNQGIINFEVTDKNGIEIVNSGDILENTLRGGKFGVYCNNQDNAQWSLLQYKCL